jgi:1,4-alpha-glucan branching enzyme
MDKEMYSGMSDFLPASSTIDRGIALQKVYFSSSTSKGFKWFLNVFHHLWYILFIAFQTFQTIHFITMALGGDGYLNFMGNEVLLY